MIWFGSIDYTTISWNTHLRILLNLRELFTAHLHSKWSIYNMDHLRPTLCYNSNTRVRIGSWSLQLNSTFVRMVWVSNTIMVVILWLGNLKWNLKKTFCSKFQNCWEEKNPQPSWNSYTKYLLKYSILGNWVLKWLLIFVFDTAMIQIFGWITQNLFQKSGI